MDASSDAPSAAERSRKIVGQAERQLEEVRGHWVDKGLGDGTCGLHSGARKLDRKSHNKERIQKDRSARQIEQHSVKEGPPRKLSITPTVDEESSAARRLEPSRELPQLSALAPPSPEPAARETASLAPLADSQVKPPKRPKKPRAEVTVDMAAAWRDQPDGPLAANVAADQKNHCVVYACVATVIVGGVVALAVVLSVY